ncbi:PaaI family thioesterase [Sneathiella chinensis]|uniref:Thioesterase n=1 Tax=Sneathiella chinensis TaxID=349750 RepID=A0ABQ5U3M8_9PROT|nr:PaaI family thioesterase [Sneathiella chinensis]GLQ06509.1 thioesterase [Sneathiella chinensis]
MDMTSEQFLDVISKARETREWKPVFEIIPYFSYLGLELEECEGRIICRLPKDKKFIGNPVLPALHGGIVGAFLETTALVHMLMTQDVTRLPKIINITVEYLRSAKLEDSFAEAVITKPGRRVANMRVRAWQESKDKPIATASANFLVS